MNIRATLVILCLVMTPMFIAFPGYFSASLVETSSENFAGEQLTIVSVDQDEVLQELQKKLRSKNIHERKEAEEILAMLEEGPIAGPATILNREIRRDNSIPENLTQNLFSDLPDKVEETEKQLMAMGEKVLKPWLMAISQYVASEHQHTNVNLSETEKSITAEKVVKKTSESVKNVKIKIAENLAGGETAHPQKRGKAGVKQLIAELYRCRPGVNCEVVEKLVQAGDEARDALIQALLAPHDHTRSLAKLILSRRAMKKTDGPLFHNYQDTVTSSAAEEPLGEGGPVVTEFSDFGRNGSGMSTDSSSSLAGTSWKGTDSTGEELVFDFQKGGKITYTTSSGTFENAVWNKQGPTLKISVNQGFAEYWGIVDGDHMFGRAENRNGDKWAWEFEKQ